MMKFLTALLITFALLVSPTVFAKKGGGGPAGPDPVITVALECDNGSAVVAKHCRYWEDFGVPGWENCADDNDPGNNEFPPFMKNAIIDVAIIGANHQTGNYDGDEDLGNVDNPKCDCLVTRTTPGNPEPKLVYYIEGDCR